MQYSHGNAKGDANRDIKKAVKIFERNYKKIMGREYKKYSLQEIRRIYEEELKEIRKNWKPKAVREYQENFKREIKNFEKTGILFSGIWNLDKINIDCLDRVIEFLEMKKSFFKEWGRRKSGGCPPKPFNVFLYHLVNKLTHWKYDKNRKLLLGKNRKPKLERDWKLILFMLLWIHFHKFSFKELEDFIIKNQNKSLLKTLSSLRKKIQREYSNFRPMRGEFFPTDIDGVGYRFTRITDKGYRFILL